MSHRSLSPTILGLFQVGLRFARLQSVSIRGNSDWIQDLPKGAYLQAISLPLRAPPLLLLITLTIPVTAKHCTILCLELIYSLCPVPAACPASWTPQVQRLPYTNVSTVSDPVYPPAQPAAAGECQSWAPPSTASAIPEATGPAIGPALRATLGARQCSCL